MIIVEGPDGGGKTTLAKAIVEDFVGLEYRRPPEKFLTSTHGPSDGLQEWWHGQLTSPRAERSSGVYDRCMWISEPIYAATTLRPSIISTDTLHKSIHDLWAEDPILIFCMTDPQQMQENVFASGRDRNVYTADDDRKDTAINFAYWAYYALWRECGSDVFLYDYQNDDRNNLFTQIDDALRGRHSTAAYDRPYLKTVT